MCILSVDPGATHTGFAVMRANEVPVLDWVETVHSEECLRDNKFMVELGGNSLTKRLIVYKKFKELLIAHRPLVVVCESTYLDPRKVTAFSSLTKLLEGLTLTLLDVYPDMVVEFIPANIVKNSVGAKGGSDKTYVKAGLKNQSLDWNGFDIEMLDEHSIDAIAVGVCKCKQFNEVLENV